MITEQIENNDDAEYTPVVNKRRKLNIEQVFQTVVPIPQQPPNLTLTNRFTPLDQRKQTEEKPKRPRNSIQYKAQNATSNSDPSKTGKPQRIHQIYNRNNWKTIPSKIQCRTSKHTYV